jgi:hypothetical protein
VLIEKIVQSGGVIYQDSHAGKRKQHSGAHDRGAQNHRGFFLHPRFYDGEPKVERI